MFNSQIIEIVISLVFMYLLLSLLGTTLNELLAAALHLRGRNLRKSLAYMLSDPGNSTLFQKFMEHPLFKKLRRNSTWKLPSYLPAQRFSHILADCLEAEPGEKMKEVEATISKMEGDTGKILQRLFKEAQGNLNTFMELAAKWYEEVQERATGWYKRYTQRMLLFIGFLIALSVNADTIRMVDKLALDSNARSSVTELAMKQSMVLEEIYSIEAGNAIAVSSQIDSSVFVSSTLEEIRSLSNEVNSIIGNSLEEADRAMGIGWQSLEQEFYAALAGPQSLWVFFLLKFFGFALTAIAISLGSSFWFDILNKAIKSSRGLQAEIQGTSR